jgi:hypothetical protein
MQRRNAALISRDVVKHLELLLVSIVRGLQLAALSGISAPETDKV